MSASRDYSIHTDVKYGPLARIDLPSIAAAVREPWWNQSLCRVNDCVVRLGVVQGEFHWHEHEDEDELFLVLEGTLLIDLERETVTLGPQQAYTVPRGVRHRTRAPERVVVLMVEGSGVRPEGDGAA